MKKDTNTNSHMCPKGMILKDAFESLLLKIMYKATLFSLDKASSIEKNAFYCLSDYTKLPLMNLVSHIHILHSQIYNLIRNNIYFLNDKYSKYIWDG